ncbi:MAG: aspartate aminotransferase family protein [Acidobacteria bacterium]|jgi:glutamate/tyrosine decarboxylase-like PLP-dependent enzyme|nr:aspartate aminotransferase family protein [Acidobacteriota bacterium]
MERAQIPISAFVDPQGNNREQIKLLVEQFVSLVIDCASEANERSPLPLTTINFDSLKISDDGIPEKEILDDLHRILSESMNPAHTGYIGHMDTMPTTFSILGDFAAAAVNNNMLSLEMSPVFSRLENALVKQTGRLFGLGENSGGLMIAGGSLANLQALAVARNFFFDSRENGVVGLEQQPVIFASEAAHTSILKAAMLLGLGTASVVKIKINRDSQMEAADLRQKIEQSKTEGKAPFCVVGTAGTTVTGNIDPLEEINLVAKEFKLWFHVDAAYGGALVFSEKYRHRLAGIEYADSITFNPQKWLYVAKTCAMVLFKDAGLLDSSFRVAAPYMRGGGGDDELINIGERSVQGTHHADILKYWLSLQHIGKSGYSQLIDESYRLSTYLAEQIKSRAFLKIAGKPELNLVCFRGEPDWITLSGWDDWNARLQSYLLRQGSIFVSLPVYRESRWLRTVFLNPFTNEEIIDALMTNVDAFAANI